MDTTPRTARGWVIWRMNKQKLEDYITRKKAEGAIERRGLDPEGGSSMAKRVLADTCDEIILRRQPLGGRSPMYW